MKEKKRQKVWMAWPEGGEEVYLDTLFPKEKVSLLKKILTIMGIIGALALLILIGLIKNNWIHP